MNKKRDLLNDILTWSLIIICVVSLWGCGFLTGLKIRENVENTPSIVLNEKKANEDINADFITIPQSFIVGGFIERIYTPTQRDNLYFLQTQVNSSFDIYNGYINGFTINIDICLSSALRYDTDSSFTPVFNDSSKQSFDIPIDYEISLDSFSNIDLFLYINDFASDEFEIIGEIYINDSWYNDIYLYYVPLFTISNIIKTFDLGSIIILLDSNIIEEYSLSFDDGFADGKEVGYDEGYYDRTEEYESTDSAFEMVWQFISNAFASVFNVFDIELFAGIKLFHILAIPLIISVLYFVIKILAK